VARIGGIRDIPAFFLPDIGDTGIFAPPLFVPPFRLAISEDWGWLDLPVCYPVFAPRDVYVRTAGMIFYPQQQHYVAVMLGGAGI
jgi:hypothetical protein